MAFLGEEFKEEKEEMEEAELKASFKASIKQSVSARGSAMSKVTHRRTKDEPNFRDIRVEELQNRISTLD